MSDLISRQAAIDAVDEALTRVFVEHRDIAEKMINKIPSVQPEPPEREISYRDCCYAMVKMWIIDVLTDEEYLKIMDKLNEHEKARRDLISRQDALDAFGLSEKTRKYGGDHSGYDTRMLYEIQDVLESLPSAQPEPEELDFVQPHKKIGVRLEIGQPERSKGEWIYGEHDIAMCDGYRCNQCGFFVPWDYKHKFIDFIKDYHWCPFCGADMRGE